MNKPIITWYVEDIKEKTYIPYEEYYAGSFSPNEYVELKLCIWNNRWGQEDTANADNLKIFIYFENLEDSILLDSCSVSVDNGAAQQLKIDAGRGVIDLKRTLKGFANDGSYKNNLNYCMLNIRFGPLKEGLKNSIKNLFLSPDYNSVGER